MAMNPLKQFAIHEVMPLEVAGYNVAITNQAIWMFIAVGAVLLTFILGSLRPKMIPGRLQAFVEMTYGFVSDMVKNTAGHSATPFIPLIMTLFLFVACLNLFGMIPGSFTSTSQIYMTGYMAALVFFMVIFVGFKVQGVGFLKLFVPAGTPGYLLPLIVPLEIISFFARPLTLAVRLAANMVAGHVLLKIFATFATMMIGWLAVTAVAPLIALIAISGLEVFVAVLQAYIFTILTCVYLNDALHGH